MIQLLYSRKPYAHVKVSRNFLWLRIDPGILLDTPKKKSTILLTFVVAKLPTVVNVWNIRDRDAEFKDLPM